MRKPNQQQSEIERLRHIIRGVHGALTDAATVPVPDLDADLYESVMQIVRDRNEAQAEVAAETKRCADIANNAIRGCVTDEERDIATTIRNLILAAAKEKPATRDAPWFNGKPNKELIDRTLDLRCCDGGLGCAQCDPGTDALAAAKGKK